MTLSIGYRADRRVELACGRCGHPIVLKRGDLLKPCTACMHIEFHLRQRTPEATGAPADGSTRAAELTERAGHLLDLHAAWMTPYQRQGLARVLGELLAEAAGRPKA